MSIVGPGTLVGRLEGGICGSVCLLSLLLLSGSLPPLSELSSDDESDSKSESGHDLSGSVVFDEGNVVGRS